MVGSIATCLPARAQHSYDFNYESRLVTLTGMVKLLALENPHTRIVIAVRNAAGVATGTGLIGCALRCLAELA